MDDRALKKLKIDPGFVRDLIDAHGCVGALSLLENYLEANNGVPQLDGTLHTMLQNVLNSIQVLNTLTATKYTTLTEIQHLGQVSMDTTIVTVCRHIICGADDLMTYVQGNTFQKSNK